MSKIGVFYGPEKGSTEKVAQMIVDKLGADKADLLSIEKTTGEEFLKYDKMILGTATIGRDTWDNDHGVRGWDVFLPKMHDLVGIETKTMAIFGLGNHVIYPTMFCDSMATVAEEMKAKGAKLVGSVETEGYEFEDSAAIVDGKFLGLPVDEDNEEELTEKRINDWVEQLKPALGV